MRQPEEELSPEGSKAAPGEEPREGSTRRRAQPGHRPTGGKLGTCGDRQEPSAAGESGVKWM